MELLSPQQRQIWKLYEQGYGAKRIARTLEISVDQVKVQLRRIKAKMEGGNKNFGQKPLGVSCAHEGLEEILESLQDTSSQIDFLRENGYKPSAIANTLGVNIKKVYNRNYDRKRSSFKRGFMPKEELRSLPSQGEVLDLDIARVIYEVFVNNDPSYETLAMLGTQNLGGWRAKRVALTRRAGMLKALAVSGREKGKVLRITDKKGPWWEMIKDLVEKYRRVGADTYIPDDWSAFAWELKSRIEVALEGLHIEPQDGREDKKVFEVVCGVVAVVIRPLPGQASISVPASLYNNKPGTKKWEGLVSRDIEGLKVDGQPVELEGILIKNRKAIWFTRDPGILQNGDKVRVREGFNGYVIEVLTWNPGLPEPRVVRLKDEDLAWAVAVFVIGKDGLKEDYRIEIEGKLYNYRDAIKKMAI
ncbi:response regulator containing a CheY-like receiver domain and an HTH DNA-binding domain [Moorella thermoacetica Y72]|uniref:Response regulator containing a CheY-like receiver domain and an HTH DNA-binding domain n=2 Tax=Neomoorella thermoacetica TaxID=1525 RepID=A0A0S6UIV2_NEOTH|nr:response regulator containing a CheY-like receiver domain and an HTH DNA-binding domain [Moorella thermoacetica Y72]